MIMEMTTIISFLKSKCYHQKDAKKGKNKSTSSSYGKHKEIATLEAYFMSRTTHSA
jgi:hypothetical protein